MARKTKTNGRSLIIHTPVPTDVEMLNPAPYNPRKIKPAKLAALKQKIREVGFLDPLVIQKWSEKHSLEYVIVGGHQRLRAVREVCEEEGIALPLLPCIILDVDDRTAMKLNIALNNINGEWDTHLLAKLLAELNADDKMTETEIGGMGMSEDEFDKYVSLVEDDPEIPPEPMQTFGKSVTCSLAFSDVGQRDSVKKRLEEIAKLESKRTGEVVFEMLNRSKVKRGRG